MNGFAHLANAIRSQASLSGMDLSEAHWGEISSYDPYTGAVKINLLPEGEESGWMALGGIGVGNGSGVFVGPNMGDMVLAVFAGGDFNSGTIIGRFYSVKNQAMGVPAGEIWARHATGSSVKLLNGGNVEANATGDANVTAVGSINLTAPNIVLNGAIILNGPISQTNTEGGSTEAHLIGPVTVDNDVTAEGKSLSGHHHRENGAGNETDPPT